MVLALIKTAFAQETPEAAHDQWRVVADHFRSKLPKLAALLDEAENDVLAFTDFPRAHRKQIASTNPVGWLNAEIKRRTDVVGIFPNEAAIAVSRSTAQRSFSNATAARCVAQHVNTWTASALDSRRRTPPVQRPPPPRGPHAGAAVVAKAR